MKKNLLLIIVSILALQCKKTPFSDLSGNFTLKGIVMVYDTLSGVVNIAPGKSMRVYLKYDNGGANYLNYVTAKDQGQYSFTGIDVHQSYTIYASSDTGTLKYYGEKPYTSGQYSNNQSDTLKLYPAKNNQNGIHLRVVSASGAPIGNVSAWVFNNPFLFASDTSAGKIFDLVTNSYGVANKFNIAPGTYYLRVKTKIGSIDYAGEDNVNIETTGIKDVTLTMLNTPLTRNGIEANLTDIYTTPVANATVYCYKSQYVFEQDTISFSNSLFKMTSNSAGHASAYIIDPGTYFLHGIKIINPGDTLKAKGIVNVTASSIPPPVNMILKR